MDNATIRAHSADDRSTRGVADNHGHHLAALKALEHLAASDGIPLNVRVIIEGEEEVNGESLPHHLRSHGEELRTDAVLLWDSVMQSDGSQNLATTVRGILYTSFGRAPRRSICIPVSTVGLLRIR